MARRGNGEGTIYKRPDGLYCARMMVGYNDEGKQIRKAFYGKTRKEVVDKLNEAIHNKKKGVVVDPTNITVGEWLETWFEEYKKRQVRVSTYSRDRTVADSHVFPALGHIRLKDLRPEDVQRFVNGLHDKGLSHNSIVKAYQIVNGATNQAVDNEMINRNRFNGKIIFPNKKQKEIRVLTKEEQKKFIEAAHCFTGGDVFVFILGTGLRIGEAMALTWDDIDFEKMEISINKTVQYVYDYDGKKYRFNSGPPKTDSSCREIPLLPELLELLHMRKEMHIPGNGVVFQNRFGGHYTDTSLRNHHLRKITEYAGLKGVTLHSLRHTFATRGLENGVEMVVMQKILGHANIKETADTYTHVLPDKLQDSMMKLSGTLKI